MCAIHLYLCLSLSIGILKNPYMLIFATRIAFLNIITICFMSV